MGKIGEIRRGSIKRLRRVYGPVIHLSDSKAAAHHNSLHIKELFIIWHQLGHLINGDFQGLKLSDKFLYYIENEAHHREHMADLIGFMLLLNALDSNEDLTKEKRMAALFSVTELFEIFYMISDSKVETHPAPIRRAYCITEHFYGPKYTEFLEKSYKNLDLIEQIIGNEPVFDSVEKEIGELSMIWFFLQSNGKLEEWLSAQSKRS